MSIRMFKARSPEWLRFRKTVISATEASSLIGVNSYMTASQLVKEKLIETSAPLDNVYIRDGLIAEQAVFSALELQGWHLDPLSPRGKSLVWVNEETYPSLSSTPDNFRWDEEEPAIVEVKSTTEVNFENYWNGSVPPLRYITQVHVQMHTTGMKKGYLVCTTLQPNLPISVYEINGSYTKLIIELIQRTLPHYVYAFDGKGAIRTSKEVRDKAVELLSQSAKFIGVFRYEPKENTDGK